MNETVIEFCLTKYEYYEEEPDLSKCKTRKNAVYFKGLKKTELIENIRRIKLECSSKK
jgi:hypothetical protein